MKKGALFISICLVFLSGTAVYQYFNFNDGKLHIVFCDVGQGDGIFIRTPNGKNILIDGGPDRKVVGCLSDHMPFWERKLDLMLLTHPHADHFMGMFYVLERYNITAFATEKLENKSEEFQQLMKQLKEKDIPVRYVVQGDRWVIKGTYADVILAVLGPTQVFLEKTNPTGAIGDSKEFASLVIALSYTDFHTLFTGDTQTAELGEIASDLDQQNSPIDILQSPHHGSKTGLNQEIVQQINSKLAIISVGEHNRYGHPHKQTLDLFNAAKIPVLRTDQQGSIEIVSDGSHFYKK